MKKTPITLALLGLLCGPEAAAQVCSAGADPQPALQYLRRLSLDLRGRLPDVAELESVVTNGSVDPAIIDQLISDEALVTQLRRHHRDLLWSNVEDVRLLQNAWNIRGSRNDPNVPLLITANGRYQVYRGGAASCRDEPATFGADGLPETLPDPNDSAIQREGYVMVAPYWAPTTMVKVCAFDAQANLTALDPRGNTVNCATNANAKGCGCGPNLAWCENAPANTNRVITGAMSEQVLRYIDRIIRDDRPYTDVVLGRDLEINGPLAFWLHNQAAAAGYTHPAGVAQNFDVPNLDYTDQSWIEVTRGARHAGVLSMPGFLLKFQSNRGRANRFYNAFLCQHFETNEPLPPSTDACHQEPDLTKRCGCKGCHQAVEPAAAYWGRWAESGVLPMEEATFPRYLADCARTGRASPFCRAFYFTAEEVNDTAIEGPFVGQLRSYVFADAAREENIAAGPEGIARGAIDSGRYASCTVERMWRLFMSRAPTVEEESAIAGIAEDFKSDYRLRRLVKTIVTRPEYVEAGLYGEEE